VCSLNKHGVSEGFMGIWRLALFLGFIPKNDTTSAATGVVCRFLRTRKSFVENVSGIEIDRQKRRFRSHSTTPEKKNTCRHISSPFA